MINNKDLINLIKLLFLLIGGSFGILVYYEKLPFKITDREQFETWKKKNKIFVFSLFFITIILVSIVLVLIFKE